MMKIFMPVSSTFRITSLRHISEHMIIREKTMDIFKHFDPSCQNVFQKSRVILRDLLPAVQGSEEATF